MTVLEAKSPREEATPRLTSESGLAASLFQVRPFLLLFRLHSKSANKVQTDVAVRPLLSPASVWPFFLLASCIPAQLQQALPSSLALSLLASLLSLVSLSLLPNLSCQVPTETAELRAHFHADKVHDPFLGDV